jgi:protein subunit release factor B
MPKYGVTPQKEEELLARMTACNLREQDIEESFIRSGGSGGQKVNKTASCVYLKHTPSGLEVKMQKARSQALNRFYARRRLCELLEEKQQGTQSPQALRILKLRKQKARRGRRARSATDLEALKKSEEEE